MAKWRADAQSPSSGSGKSKAVDSTRPTSKAHGSSPSAPDAAAKISWKGKSTSAASRPFWVAGGGRRTQWRGWALTLAGLSIVALGTIFSIQILRGDKPTPCIIVTGLEYDSPWMPNGWAKEDSDRLASWFNAKENKQSLQCGAHQEGKNGSWDEILKQQLGLARPGGPGGNLIFWKYSSLVVYLSAHGVLRNGQPCLVFANETVVELRDVLKAIVEHKQQQDSRILLIIDSGRQLPDARLTHFQHDFYPEAQRVIESQTRKHLAVLFSCGDQQFSWSAPELGGSAFGAFIAKAFVGEADRSRNYRLTVQELTDYVSTHVANYVLRTRSALQQPKLVWSQGQVQDFEVSYCDPDSQRAVGVAAEVDASRVGALKTAWDEFEPWRDKMLRIDPWRVAQVRDELSYADQLIWSGSAYNKQASENIDQARRHMQAPLQRRADLTGSSRFDGQPSTPVFHAVSTAPSLSPETKAAPEAATPPVAKPPLPPTFADLAKEFLEHPTTPEGKDREAPQTQDFHEYTTFAWWWLKQNDPQHWSRLGLMNLAKLQPQQNWVSQSLRAEDAILLAVFEDLQSNAAIWDSGDPSTDQQWPGFLTMWDEFQRRVIGPLEREPRALPSVRSAADSLLARMRVARDQLHARRLPEVIPNEAIDALADSDQQASETWRILDEVADELPLMINWPMATESTADIQSLIDACAAFVNASPEHRAQLSTAREDLRRRYSQQVHSLAEEREAASADSFQRLQMHLTHRPIHAGERSQLHDKMKSHLRALTALNLADSRIELASLPDERPATFEPLRLSASLLKSYATLSGQAVGDDPGLGFQKSWSTFIAAIAAGRGWWEGLESDDADTLRLAARRVRFTTNWAPRSPLANSVQLPPLFDAARLEEEMAWHSYLLWRAGDCIDDFWRTPQASIGSDEPYFALCAQAYLAAAKELMHGSKAARDIFRNRLTQKMELSTRWQNVLEEGQPLVNSDSKSVSIDWNSSAYPAGVARIAVRWRRLGDEQTKLKEAIAVGGDTKSNHLETQVVGAETARLLADYRGHRASAQFAFAKAPSRWTLSNNFRVDPKTTVTVVSAPQPIEIVFALDCSGSFRKEDFETAKNALRRALEEIQGRELLKIALVVFGHSRNFPGTKFPEDNDVWRREFPGKSGARFDSDVVTLEGLAPATRELVDRMNKYLDKLEPFGATPLFLAAQRSKELLDASYQGDPTREVHRRVIVITDGENNVTATRNGQPVPATPEYIRYRPEPQNDRQAGDVEAAFKRLATARLDVMHIGNSTDTAMRDLAVKFQGTFRNTNFNAIADDLSQSLNPLRFSVVHTDKRRVSDKLVLFKTEWPLANLPADGSSETYRIVVTSEGNEVAAKDVLLHSGDRLAVEYSPSQKIFTFPYRRPQRLPLKLDEGLQAWRIESRNNSRDVRFVFDAPDLTHQTLRPALAFIEVGAGSTPTSAVNKSATAGSAVASPALAGSAIGDGQPHLAFYSADLVWESRALRPTCLLTIDRGPEAGGATPLPARLWVRRSMPKKEGSLAMTSVSATANDDQFRDIGGVKILAKGAIAAGSYELLVTLIPDSQPRLIVVPPKPDAAEQQFFSDGKVTLKYVYAEKPDGEIEFYAVPTAAIAAGDAEWRSTGWVETDR